MCSCDPENRPTSRMSPAGNETPTAWDEPGRTARAQAYHRYLSGFSADHEGWASFKGSRNRVPG